MNNKNVRNCCGEINYESNSIRQRENYGDYYVIHDVKYNGINLFVILSFFLVLHLQ